MRNEQQRRDEKRTAKEEMRNEQNRKGSESREQRDETKEYDEGRATFIEKMGRGRERCL
jgi:hypothetical protein